MSSDSEPGALPRSPGKEPPAAPLPKRFYKSAAVVPLRLPADFGAGEPQHYQIELDGRPLRTPRKRALAIPSLAIADVIAAEWAGQGERIDPATMPMTRIVNTALDAVVGREAAVADDVVRYAGSDLVCYRADNPEGLVSRQSEAWDPVLAWAGQELGARFECAVGLMPIVQPSSAVAAVADALRPLSALELAGAHVMTTLTGSALITLAHARGRLTLEEAWRAAHVDEDWQIEKWGCDQEAVERRAHRLVEMETASRLVALHQG